jgi:hypothetical protein
VEACFDSKPLSEPALIEPRGESCCLSSRATRCFRSIRAFSSSGKSSSKLISLPLPGVPGLTPAAIEGLLDDPSPASEIPAMPRPLGVPTGVARAGMLGSGGVPVYCARKSRAEGDPDMLGLPLMKSGLEADDLGLAISIGFDGLGLLDDGEDMVGGCGG